MSLLNNPNFLALPGKKHKVSDFDPTFTAHVDSKKEAEKLLQDNIEKLIEIQGKLYADNHYSVLLVFQAMDAAGKDGTIKHVMSGLNPQGTQVYSFKSPSEMELDHDYFWRTYCCLPQRGNFGIFNRSYYEEVLIVKVHPQYLLRQRLPGIKKVEDAGKDFWDKRYRQINDIERHLTENGTVIIKFFLNVSKDQQKRRFLKRIDDPARNWKFSSADVKERQHWEEYMDAYSDLLSNTSTEIAPWYVIPADNKWFMRYAVSDIIASRLQKLDLAYPVLPGHELNRLGEAKSLLENE
ncbi:MAG: polyphosphate kinase 2 family protein [Bacteroidales bacterium]|nr:polyphosphate kinase 2 family protein [Bacteroidales bacterium]